MLSVVAVTAMRSVSGYMKLHYVTSHIYIKKKKKKYSCYTLSLLKKKQFVKDLVLSFPIFAFCIKSNCMKHVLCYGIKQENICYM